MNKHVGFRVGIILENLDGTPNTTLTPVCSVRQDGEDLASCTNAPTQRTLGGVATEEWDVVLTDDEANGDLVVVHATAAGCKPFNQEFYPESVWIPAKAAFLDASISGLGTALSDAAGTLLAAIAGLSIPSAATIAAAVWAAATRTLTGIDLSAVGAFVWGYATRTLTTNTRLVVESTNTGTARSIHDLGAMAWGMYPPPPKSGVSQYSYEQWVEEGFRQLVHEAGGIYHATLEQELLAGVAEFAIPADFREMRPNGVSLFYTPRNITAISRSGGTASVTTDTAHALSTGMQIGIEGVTPGGASAFDTPTAVVTVTGDHAFTYASAGADDAGASGGQVTGPERLVLPVMNQERVDRGASAATPYAYYYSDALTLALTPASDGLTYPALVLDYDAEVPAPLDHSLNLPIPSYLERGLIGYAAAMAGGRGELMGLYETAVAQWRAARSQREERE